MSIDEFESYVRGLGFTVEPLEGRDGGTYTVIRALTIPAGTLRGRQCDVAIRRETVVPYIPPAAIHTRPPLVPMGTLSTQPSPVGPDWQYWSRRFDRAVTPSTLWTHILTILAEVR
jgi:hypothetical protein